MADTIVTACRDIDEIRRELEDLQHAAVGDLADHNNQLLRENGELRAQLRRQS